MNNVTSRKLKRSRLVGARSGAFTLIEIVITLFIISIMLGVATLSFRGVEEQGRIQRDGTAIKLAARKLMREAMTQNRSYTMSLGTRFFTTGPTYTPGLLENNLVDADDVVQQIRGKRVDLREGMTLMVRRWNETAFRFPRQPVEPWVFEPGGICEPLTIRLDYNGGYLVMTFNPLTAGVEEEELYIP